MHCYWSDRLMIQGPHGQQRFLAQSGHDARRLRCQELRLKAPQALLLMSLAALEAVAPAAGSRRRRMR